YRNKKEGQWMSVSFQEAVDMAEKISAGFADQGIKKGDRIAIISANRMEWALSDYAALFLGAVLVPLYPSLIEHQIEYILNDSQAKIIIAEDGFQAEKIDKIRQNLKTVEHFFIIEKGEIEDGKTWPSLTSLQEKGADFLKHHENYIAESIELIKREDIATIIYTSGTTGEPKGVILAHKNFLANLESVSKLFDCYPEDEFLSFLPLSHILERTAGHYFSCYHGATVAYAEGIDSLPDNLVDIKPTLMISVPRLFEKMYGRILEAVENGSPLKRKIFYWSIKTGREFMKYKMAKQPAPVLVKIKQGLASKLVFGKLSQRLGGRIRYCISGGAPLPAPIGEFFNSAGLTILEGYGLTETSPGIAFNKPEAYKFGAVGMPLPNVEVKIADDGEIMTRGDHVMLGYYNKEEETKEVIDAQGWFSTGDIGFIDEDGFLTITDRKKNIIVTSGGKNIAPQPIENNLGTSNLIEQTVVIGDRRKFCSALIVPAEDAVINWAKKNKVVFDNYIQLLEHPKLIEEIQSE
ncbi:MAG: long-chain fatty acid--CoA ligase, partial [Calditrichia bacterium]|nr:long-chain fatty acid--CoA ligase [Calditrichia bacterium]